MSTGCAKAYKKRKSAANKAYIAGRKQQINKDKKASRIAKYKAKQNKRLIIPHGAARAARREAWMFAIGGMWENKDRLSFQQYERT